MEKFAYRGYDQRGRFHQGVMDAVNEHEARKALITRGMPSPELKRLQQPAPDPLRSSRLHPPPSVPLPPPPAPPSAVPLPRRPSGEHPRPPLPPPPDFVGKSPSGTLEVPPAHPTVPRRASGIMQPPPAPPTPPPATPPPPVAQTPPPSPPPPPPPPRRNLLEDIQFDLPAPRKGSGKIEVQQAQRTGFERIPRVEIGRFKPRSLSEWVERMTLPRRLLNGLWAVLALVGALILIVRVVTGHGAGSQAAPGPLPYQNVTLKIEGQACLQDTRSLQGVKVTIHLPEIPLDLQEDVSRLPDVSERGEFVFQSSFSSQKVPTYCVVSARCAGYAPKQSREIPLTGDPLAATVPALVLTPEKKH